MSVSLPNLYRIVAKRGPEKGNVRTFGDRKGM